MLCRTLLAILAVTLTCAGHALPEFALFFQFDTTPSPLFVRTMKREMSAVLPGFSIRWVANDDLVAAAATYDRTFIVRFRGTCAVTPEEAGSEVDGPVVLAETAVADGSILPYSEIDCDRLLALLRTAHYSEAGAEAGQEARLGRAGARVLAHEMYHVLLQTQDHGRKGLAKAVHTPAALLSQSLLFEEGELEKFALHYKP